MGAAGARGATLTGEEAPERNRPHHLLVGAVGGLLLASGLPPSPLFPLGIIGVGLFVLAIERAPETRGAALAGGAFAGTASFVTLHWIPAAAEPWLGVLGALAAGISVWALHGAIGIAVASVMKAVDGILPLPLRAAASWGVIEWLPGTLPVIGIPWHPVAAALVSWPAVFPVVAVVGGAGIGILLAASWGALLSTRRYPRSSAVVLCAWGLVVVGVLARPDAPASEPASRIGVVEWDRARDALGDPVRLRREAEAFLDAPFPTDAPEVEPVPLLWPEAPVPIGRAADGSETGIVGEDALALLYMRRVVETAEPVGGIAGIHARIDGRRYNTLTRTSGPTDTPMGVHRKRYLVPGVERTTLFGAGRPERGLAPGAGALPFRWGGRVIGSIICFEILYANEIARLRRRGMELLAQATQETALAPGGRFPVVADAARRQHIAMLRLRAAEFRLPALRAAVGGVALGVASDGSFLVPSSEYDLSGGRILVFDIPATVPPPPAVWIVPAAGLASFLILAVSLVAFREERRIRSRAAVHPGMTIH